MSNARELAEFAAGYGSGSFAVGKNKIINGAMTIDQRNAGASVTPAAGPANTYILDRWAYGYSNNSKMSMQRSSTAPAGFSNSFLFTSLSAYSVGAGEYFLVNQPIEGYNIADLNWGTANAKTVTLSFWVRSSLTGTFGGSLRNSAVNRSYPFSYSISSADTWEQKSITIPGDTTGTWLTDNGLGVRLTFGLGTGSSFTGTAGAWAATNYQNATGATSVVGTSGATWYITGVQLEEGSVATPFENRLYPQELALCQRYCHAFSGYLFGRARDGDTLYGGTLSFGTTMRASPTLRAGATYTVNTGSAGTPSLLNFSGVGISPHAVLMQNSSANWTANAFPAFTGIFEAEL